MVVAKRKGREKPTKIEQRKVKGPRTGVRTSGRMALLAKPDLHRTGPGGRKKHKKRSQRAFSFFSLSLFLSLSLSLSLSLGRSSLCIFGLMCPHASKMDFPAIF